MNRSIAFLAAALAVLSFAGLASAQTAYRIVDLGTLAMQSNAAAINNSDQVVGTSVAADSYFNAASFGLGGPVPYAPFVGYRNAVATTITDSGVAFGVGFNLGSRAPVALRFDSSGPVALGTFVPRASRADGTLVGAAPIFTAAGLTYDVACVYSGGTLTNLTSLGGAFSQAFDIDASGRIVGSSTLTGGADPKPALWSNGVPSNLGTLGGARGQARAMNDSGVIVGFSENAAGLARPTRWTVSAAGTVLTRVDLSSPFPTRSGFVNDVNGSGTAVGTSAFHAVRWLADGTSADLNTLCPQSNGWMLEVAAAVNSRGVIVGTGTLLGFPRAFMLVPITCRVDFNSDGAVDFFDYLDFVAAFAGGDIAADYNLDTVVDFFDYLDFVADFSAGC